MHRLGGVDIAGGSRLTVKVGTSTNNMELDWVVVFLIYKALNIM